MNVEPMILQSSIDLGKLKFAFLLNPSLIRTNSVAYNIILPILLIVSLGVFLGRRFNYSPRVLSGAAFYLFTPALVIDGLAKSSLQSGEIGLILSLEIVLSLLMALIGWVFGRVLGFDRGLTSAFMLTVTFINAGNYGLALAEFAFGLPGLQLAIIFLSMETLLLYLLIDAFLELKIFLN